MRIYHCDRRDVTGALYRSSGPAERPASDGSGTKPAAGDQYARPLDRIPALDANPKSVFKQAPDLGRRLLLEITEGSTIMVLELVSTFISDLQRKSISFALDDFGVGQTAFRPFKQFHFDVLKIDGHFIRNNAHDPDNQVIKQALVTIDKQFDMFTVAECVETPAEAAWLQALGGD